ncbi:helix-turn-helix transcriptional regulator [Aquitalea sp. LB_tupeE]|uniref:helix-turn-helix transcriptional regulator n=1 Tax=Aquitalea sp. LB_tupeE TaxID=2748078 RepID=UPI0015BB7481|nr:helix-turn-helix transcriptional regulator [Aquitalea sp. LB_tupeE]NWK80337.1 helix-turn-helix transcriptional regulator [Aquitalea sp. LB_tupeE]
MSDTSVKQDYRSLRRQTGLNQQQFWSQVFVTQSGGSRYENERRVPAPVAELVRLRHELDIDTSKITPANADLVRSLLSGEINADALLAAAQRCKLLMAALGSAAADLGNLSCQVDQILCGAASSGDAVVT